MIQSFFKANKFCFLLPVWEVKSWKKCETLWHFGGWERKCWILHFLYFGWKNNLLYILWKENKRTVIITAASLNAIESLMILFYFNFTFLRQFRSGCLPGSLPVYRYGDSGGIHPCYRALDLIPIYPLSGVGVEECGLWPEVRKFGEVCYSLMETIFTYQNSLWQYNHSSVP